MGFVPVPWHGGSGLQDCSILNDSYSKNIFKGMWIILQSKTGVLLSKEGVKGFPGGAVVKNPPANAGDTGSSPGPGRSHMLRSN